MDVHEKSLYCSNTKERSLCLAAYKHGNKDKRLFELLILIHLGRRHGVFNLACSPVWRPKKQNKEATQNLWWVSSCPSFWWTIKITPRYITVALQIASLEISSLWKWNPTHKGHHWHWLWIPPLQSPVWDLICTVHKMIGCNKALSLSLSLRVVSCTGDVSVPVVQNSSVSSSWQLCFFLLCPGAIMAVTKFMRTKTATASLCIFWHAKTFRTPSLKSRRHVLFPPF